MKESKEYLKALDISIKDAKRQLKGAVKDKNYSYASSSQCFLNGLLVAKSLAKKDWKKTLTGFE